MTKNNLSKKVSKHHGFWKKQKTFFFPKTRAPGKTGISREPRILENQTFFHGSFLLLNSQQVHVKKINFLTYEDLSCPKAYNFAFLVNKKNNWDL
jgi:hypothetical protein